MHSSSAYEMARGSTATSPTLGDAQSTYEFRGRLDVLRSTNLEIVAGHDLVREDANAIDAASLDGTRGNQTVNRVTVAANHRFNRLSLNLRGGLSETTYEDDPFAAARNFTQRTLTGRATWSFRPTLAAFGEVGYDRREREGPVAGDGLSRSSDGERVRLGLSFGETGAILRGEASLGYGRQRPDAAALPDAEAFLIDANLAWRITPLTSLLFTADTNIDETSVAGASATVGRRMGLAVRHAFRRHLIGETGVTYASQDYVGSTLDENEIEFRARRICRRSLPDAVHRGPPQLVPLDGPEPGLRGTRCPRRRPCAQLRRGGPLSGPGPGALSEHPLDLALQIIAQVGA